MSRKKAQAPACRSLPAWAEDLFADPQTGEPLKPVIGPHGFVDLLSEATGAIQNTSDELAFWASSAAEYDTAVLGGDLPHARRRIERLVRSVLDPTDAAGPLTLEIGCGTGDMTRYHVGAGRRIVACDISPDMLRVARQRLESEPDAVLVAANMLALPVREGAFDSAVGIGALHHIPDDLPRFFEGLWRALRPGGRFAFREPSWDSLFSRWYFVWRRSDDLSPNEMPLRACDLVAAARAAGFDELKTALAGLVLPMMPAPVAWLAERLEPAVSRTPLVGPWALGGVLISGRRP